MGHGWRLAVVVAGIGLVAGGAAAVARAARNETYHALDVYTEAMTIIHNQYVDELPWSKIRSLAASSTILPAYMIATRSQVSATSPMSWEMSTIAIPDSSCNFSMRSMIWA